MKLVVCPCAYGNVIAEPPLDAVNQPVNTKPERVGADGSESDPPVVVEPSDTAVPPCESYVTVCVGVDE